MTEVTEYRRQEDAVDTSQRYQPVPGERRVAGDPLDVSRAYAAFLGRKRPPPPKPVVFVAPGSSAGTLRPAG